MIQKIFYTFLLTWKMLNASFCGNAAIPYSFEATKTGQPVLGCARPSCFGWTSEGKAISSAPAFYRVNKKPDGFLRKDKESHGVMDIDVAENFSPQKAKCPTTFEHEQCPKDDQWVGGIAPVTNISGLPLALQCCTYEKLGLAEDRGVAVVNQGQIVVGGEVMKSGRQYAFDYISDVVKHVKSDGTISYDISLRRMPCLPRPYEYTLTVEDSVVDKLIEKSEKSVEKINLKSNEAPSARRIQKSYEAKHKNDDFSYEKEENSKSKSNEENRRRHKHHHQHHRHKASDESREIEKFKDKLIMELGEKLLQNQHNVTYPPPNIVNVHDAPLLEKTLEKKVDEHSDKDTTKTTLQDVGQENGFDNPFDEKEIRRHFYPVGGCASCDCECRTCGCSSSCCHGYSCFTADTMVRTVDGKNKRMDELTLTDWVLSPNKTKMIYTPMESWIHRLPSTYTNFIKFTLEDGKVLKITNKHFIYADDSCLSQKQSISLENLTMHPVYAEKVKINDCLYIVDRHNNFKLYEQRIIKKEHVYEKGLYAPMTVTSDIVVNDILASCYNIINHREMQFTFFHNVKKWSKWSKLLYRDVKDELDIPYATSFLVDLLQYILPTSIVPR